MVRDLPGVVMDDKESTVRLGLFTVWIVLVLLFELLHKRPVRGFWELTLVVEELKDTNRFLGDQVQTELIVDEFHLLPWNAFGLIDFLLLFEDVIVEELLESLVCIIDTELFE